MKEELLRDLAEARALIEKSNKNKSQDLELARKSTEAAKEAERNVVRDCETALTRVAELEIDLRESKA